MEERYRALDWVGLQLQRGWSDLTEKAHLGKGQGEGGKALHISGEEYSWQREEHVLREGHACYVCKGGKKDPDGEGWGENKYTIKRHRGGFFF